VNRLLVEGGFDLILSPGQVVPHEVIGMANYNKNVFVGTGGPEGINKSHFLGAAYGMERIMGRADTPVRRVLNYASDHFARHLPIVYAHTVVGRGEDDGRLHVRGLYVGDDVSCFERAAALSLQVNFKMLDAPLRKVVVYLDPHEFRSTWLGNKSVYRTRMAIADGGELVVLAPGLKEFGEDREIDRRHPRGAGCAQGQSGTGREPERRRASDPRLVRGTVQDHVLSGASDARRDRRGAFCLRGSGGDDAALRSGASPGRSEHHA
jgi:nickel-dependent lactate racemase